MSTILWVRKLGRILQRWLLSVLQRWWSHLERLEGGDVDGMT